ILAHNPNAPSTCTQAACSPAALQISTAGSNAPVFTLPACMQTIVRSDKCGNLLARIRPWPSASTMVTRFLPNPARLNALSIDACTCAPTTISLAGGDVTADGMFGAPPIEIVA